MADGRAPRIAASIAIAGALLAVAWGARAAVRVATVDFTNRAGVAERWLLQEQVDGDAAQRTVRRTYTRDGAPFYVETSRSRDGRLISLVVDDRRRGGESMRIDVDGPRVTFWPAETGARPRTESVTGELLAFGQVAPRLADALRARPTLREHTFRVPVPKAYKTVGMRARIVALGPTTFDVELDATEFLVRSVFMRAPYRMRIDRASGRLLRFDGHPEPYDLSAGRARSVWTTHTFAQAPATGVPDGAP